jgi:hypothetical protein
MLEPDSMFVGIFLVGVLVGWLIRFYYGKHVARDRATIERHSHLEFALVILAFTAMHIMPLVYLRGLSAGPARFRGLPAAACRPLVGRGRLCRRTVAVLAIACRLGAELVPGPPGILRGQSLVTGGVSTPHPAPDVRGPLARGDCPVPADSKLDIGASFAGLFLAIYLLRVPREEKLMLEFFGESYRDYMNRTNRLIPRLGM